jgi:hypothetical protein
MNNDFEFPKEEPVIKGGRSAKTPKETPTLKEEAVTPAREEAVGEQVHVVEGGSPEYDEAELDSIFDALMFDNAYMEEVKIGGRLTLTLKTRTGKEIRSIVELLDKSRYQMGLTMESMRALCNLVQSTVIVNGKDISGETFEKKLELIEDMPSAVIGAMIKALVKFDLKVEAAVAHGEENF